MVNKISKTNYNSNNTECIAVQSNKMDEYNNEIIIIMKNVLIRSIDKKAIILILNEM